MRLAWIDAGMTGIRLRDMTVENAKQIHNIGIRIVGVPNELDAADKDIEWAKKFLADNDLIPGPPGLGLSAVRPDPEEELLHLKKIADGVIYAGKLSAVSFRYSSGSLSTLSPWHPHPENYTQKTMDRLVENTKKLLPVAEDANCVLIPETTQWSVTQNIERMKEFVERVDSPYLRISFDPVNHMTSGRIYDSGRYITCAIDFLGDCIGTLHCKDVIVDPEKLLVSHIDEAPIGTGLLNHEAFIRATAKLEPWKLFSIEHLPNDKTRMDRIKSAYAHLKAITDHIGHSWSDPKLTRDRWLGTN